MPTPISIFWFRRDLRVDDNAGLYHALRGQHPVLPLFIFDHDILEKLEDQDDARVGFIQQSISALAGELRELGSGIIVKLGRPVEVWRELLDQHNIAAVYTNHDYEPYAIERDDAVRKLLQSRGVSFHTSKDHVIFEDQEVVKQDTSPYTVFTPYSRRWLEKLDSRTSKVAGPRSEDISFYLKSYPTRKYAKNFFKTKLLSIPSLNDIGFVENKNIQIPPPTVPRGLVRTYDKTRDFPALAGTSRLGIHFRFGTISIREKARNARELNKVFLSELIWRDFYSQILFHFPRVVGNAFRPEYDRIQWRNVPGEFDRWCAGQTGYPIVDAGMRELSTTGFMHNRVRMVTASFLTKHLLIDWRKGEAWFARKLLDFDLASNNGGWQWAAGCGTDAAPYFRIFNPTEQQKKFDADGEYVRRWVPEVGTPKYPEPMVEHKFARERCLAAFKKALS